MKYIIMLIIVLTIGFIQIPKGATGEVLQPAMNAPANLPVWISLGQCREAATKWTFAGSCISGTFIDPATGGKVEGQICCSTGWSQKEQCTNGKWTKTAEYGCSGEVTIEIE